jgi:hypothetical protein
MAGSRPTASHLPALGDQLVCSGCGWRSRIEREEDDPATATRPLLCRRCGRDHFPPPAAREIDVPRALQHNTAPHRRYLGKGFAKAYKYVRGHADVGARLVHGTVRDGRAYAWVEIGDVVFDPAYQRFYAADSWYAVIGAQKQAEYTRGEAIERVDDEGHTGPWPPWSTSRTFAALLSEGFGVELDAKTALHAVKTHEHRRILIEIRQRTGSQFPLDARELAALIHDPATEGLPGLARIRERGAWRAQGSHARPPRVHSDPVQIGHNRGQ